MLRGVVTSCKQEECLLPARGSGIWGALVSLLTLTLCVGPSICGERRMSEACQLNCERGQGLASYSWWPVLCSPQAKNGLYILKILFCFF